MSTDQEKERDLLVVMRKVLANIVKDTTPAHKDLKHPLSDNTIQDIRTCLGLISNRERELADIAGIAQEKPYYVDEKQSAEVVSITKITKTVKKSD